MCFPIDRFDEVCFFDRNTLLCTRSKNSYLALRSLLPMEHGGENELLQHGRVTGWACVTGSASEYGSWDSFTALMQKTALCAVHGTLSFRSDADVSCHVSNRVPEWLFRPGNDLTIHSNRKASFCGTPLELSYPRLSSPYGSVPREADRFAVSFRGKKLNLDFRNGIRKTEDMTHEE